MFLLIAFAYLLAFTSLAILIVPSRILNNIIPSIAGNKLKIVLPIFLISFIGIQLDNIFFYAEAGHSYFVQYKTGTQVAIIDKSGPKLKLYGEVMDFKTVNTVKFTLNTNSPVSGIVPPIDIRFNDAVKADVSLTARFALPTDEKTFIKMAKEFRSQENLIHSLMIPTGREVTRNAGRMLSAQAYISGKGGDFENYVDDQMRNGIILLNTREERFAMNENITQDDERKISQSQTIRYIVEPRIDSATGKFIRKSHSFNLYNINVTQVIVENVEPETKFKEMLNQQRDAAAQANIEKQKAQQAEYEKQRVIAQGESDKAKIRVTKEQEQIQILTDSETAKKKAKIQVETEKLAFEAAKLQAMTTKELADAEAYQKAKVFKADGALEKKLAAYERVNAGYADAIKHTKAQLVPTTIIGAGNNSTNSTALIDMLTAKTAKELAIDINAD